MAGKTYSEKLLDPHWQKKRLEVMEAAGFKCQNCEDGEGDRGETLHVHHCWYEKGFDPWDYPFTAYQCLCKDCHNKAESARLGISQLLFSLLPHRLESLLISITELDHAARHSSFTDLIGLIECAGDNSAELVEAAGKYGRFKSWPPTEQPDNHKASDDDEESHPIVNPDGRSTGEDSPVLLQEVLAESMQAILGKE